jgi:tetratricopeptide (TPR) repeat protein
MFALATSPRRVALAAALAAAIAAAVAPPAAFAHHTSSTSTKSAAKSASKEARSPLFPGMGHWTHPVTTKNTLAQKYFDQGLTLVYGFNHEEAIRSFEQAAKLDPTCAMAQWGVALAYGPNINLPMDPSAVSPAFEAITKAKALAPKASAADQAYIEALAARYAAGGGAAPSRTALDTAYVNAMRKLAAARPDDDDAQVLFAEALMNLRPWDHWKPDGTPQPGTEELVATLEKVLARTPNHPGANHYYIHTVEASPHPEKARAAADRLTKLVPGAGHLVHMPAHIRMRTGDYAGASAANAAGMTADEAYLRMDHQGEVYPLMYYSHNIHFLWASAAMEGRSAEAIRRARQASERVGPEVARQMAMAEFITPTTYFALVRFGKWEELLKEPAPPVDIRYTRGIWSYARGMALANLGRTDEARAALDSLDDVHDATAADFVVGLNSAKAILHVASAVLSAEIARKSGKTADAIAGFEEAVRREHEELRYDEPPAWYQPVRHLLGAALLEAGRAADAEAVYRADLLEHPENGWSLYGLAQALDAQGKTADAAAARTRQAKAWTKADVQLTASRF